MAFRKKWRPILDLNPDILVIQECEQLSKFKESELIAASNELIWLGDNPNKGMGIFSFNGYHIQLSKRHSSDYKYIIPIQVTGKSTFNLIGIWAMPHKTKNNSYIGQVWNSLDYYYKELNKPSLMIGDWNSNQIWDKERKVDNHSQTVDKLLSYNISSLYHILNNVKQGEETDPTFYLSKSIDKAYHIDYCFASMQMISSNTKMKIGSFESWIKMSDHMPLIIENIADIRS